VAKINPTGTGLVYAGFIGGSGIDDAFGISVDGSRNAYIAGYTDSDEATFPIVVGPDPTYNGGEDAFVTKVNPTGTEIVYSGYIGGSNDEVAWSIALDSSGYAYVTGRTLSNEETFPVSVGPDLTYNGGQDAFVARVNPKGSGLVYAGYIDGSNMEIGHSIGVNGQGNAYVTGATGSDEVTFPITVGPDLTFNGDLLDAFVAKVNLAGSGLDYAGYIGGSSLDFGLGIAVDSSGNSYVTGGTGSSETTFSVTAART
jgi:hypothetical protein